MPDAEIGGGQRHRRIDIGDIASLGEGNHLISFILAGISRKPFCQFELDDGRDKPLLTRWQRARYRLARGLQRISLSLIRLLNVRHFRLTSKTKSLPELLRFLNEP
jgi:hypothetical protein